jgi:hypothetical protein
VTSYASQPVSGQTQYGFVITGIQSGQSAASTAGFYLLATPGGSSPWSQAPSVAYESCERQLLVMMNRPGRFSLGVVVESSTLPSTGSYYALGCSLTQQP